MILADKIIKLRKKNGWSQEELAEKLNVSRQSVSKWEGAQSVPDLNKILKLGEVFNVSTDYLLKDEIENEDFGKDNTISVDSAEDYQEDSKTMSVEQVNKYLSDSKLSAVTGSAGTAMLILMSLPWVILKFDRNSTVNLICVIMMILMLTAGIIMLTVSYLHYKKYSYLDTENIILEYGGAGIAEDKREKQGGKYKALFFGGVTLTILGALPFYPLLMSFIFGSENNIAGLVGVILSILSLGIGISSIFFSVSMTNTINRLLEEGNYSRDKKAVTRIMRRINSTYWGIVIIVFIIGLFIPNSNNILFLFASVIIYCVIAAIVPLVLAGKKR